MATVLELYEKLKPKLGEAEARALLEFVEASVERKAATKEDLQRTETTLKADLQQTETTLKADLQQIETTLKADLQQTETALKADLAALKADLQRTETAVREEIHRLDLKIEVTKADLLKWTFGFWIGNVAVLSGIMFALLRAFASQ